MYGCVFSKDGTGESKRHLEYHVGTGDGDGESESKSKSKSNGGCDDVRTLTKRSGVLEVLGEPFHPPRSPLLRSRFTHPLWRRMQCLGKTGVKGPDLTVR